MNLLRPTIYRVLKQARRLVLWLLVMVAALVVAWVGIGHQLMQQVPEYRHDLEALVEDRLRTPLEVGAIHGYMDGVIPVFVLENVRLPAAGGSPARVKRVEVAVDPVASLLSRTLQTHRLVISGIHIHLARHENGNLHLKGLEGLGAADRKPDPEASMNTVLDLIYRQHRLVIEDASGVLELPDLPPLNVQDLNVALVAEGAGHRLGLTARVPDTEASIDLRLELASHARRLVDIEGAGFLRLRPNGLDPWLNALIPDVVQLGDFDGDIQAWLTLREGRPIKATVEASLTDITLQGDLFTEPVPVDSATLLAGLRVQEDALQLDVPELILVKGAEQHRLSPFAFSWSESGTWKVNSRELSLAPWRDLLSTLPLQEDVAEAAGKLGELAFTGHFTALSVEGSAGRIKRFSTRFDDLRWRAEGKIPGIEGLSGWAAGSPAEGMLMLDAPEFSLDLPLLFHNPMRFEARGPMRWARDEKEGLTLRSGWLQGRNADARGRTVLGVRAEPGQVPRLSLLAGIEKGEARFARRYIPLRKLPDGVSAWLDSAFEGGRVERGALLYEGPVRIDPSRQQDRVFQIGLRARQLALHFLDEWPQLEKVDADVFIDGREVRAREVSGELLGTRLSEATVDVVPDDEKGPELIIDSSLEGPAADLQTILFETPVRQRLPEEALSWRIGEGQLQADMLLRVPLTGGAPVRVRANGSLTDTDLSNPHRRLHVETFNGPVAFSLANGLSSEGFTAKLWDRPIKGRIEADNWRTTVRASGDVSSAALRAWLEAPWAKPARGTLAYDAVLRIPGRDSALRLDVNTDLSGIALHLPPPLKRAGGALKNGSMSFTAKDDDQLLNLTVPGLGTGLFRWRNDAFDRGTITLGSAQASRLMNEPGLHLRGTLSQMNVGDWVDWFTAEESRQPTQSSEGAASLLSGIALQVDELDVFGVAASDAVLRVSPRGKGWWFSVGSTQLAGEVIVPADWTMRGMRPLDVRVSHLVLPDAAQEGTGEPGPADELNPMDMPVADVSLDSIVLGNTDFGRWSFALRPVAQGTLVDRLTGSLPGMSVRGKIDWLRTGGGSRSRFTGSITSDNIARMLDFWDFEPFLEGNDMRVLANLDWAGSPLDVDWLDLHGNASVEVGPARFPKADSRTSSLRVLGVFSNRRLRLDFTDLYRKGLSTDSIGGDFVFDGHRVTTRNLVVSSPSAEFRISGTANLERETLDHRLEVTLPVSSNLYVGCLAGPVACAGIFVVERLWGDRLEKMTTLAYRLTGTWEKPKLEEVQGLFENN